MRKEILGVGFDALTIDETVERARELIRERRGAYVCTPNPEIVWACRNHEELRCAVKGADMVLPDGVGIVWAARVLGRAVPERVTGVDFIQALLAEQEGSVFLLGARPGVAQRAAETIAARWPQIRIVGCCDGYYEDEANLREQIRRVKPDVLMVCLGSPKQELLMHSWAGSEDIGLMAGLGGTLDVLAGDIPRAPEFFVRHKLEWFYRLWREPRRIKRVMRLPLYVMAVLKQRMKHGKGKTDRT